jgi:hypothetical protein
MAAHLHFKIPFFGDMFGLGSKALFLLMLVSLLPANSSTRGIVKAFPSKKQSEKELECFPRPFHNIGRDYNGHKVLPSQRIRSISPSVAFVSGVLARLHMAVFKG